MYKYLCVKNEMFLVGCTFDCISQSHLKLEWLWTFGVKSLDLLWLEVFSRLYGLLVIQTFICSSYLSEYHFASSTVVSFSIQALDRAVCIDYILKVWSTFKPRPLWETGFLQFSLIKIVWYGVLRFERLIEWWLYSGFCH